MIPNIKFPRLINSPDCKELLEKYGDNEVKMIIDEWWIFFQSVQECVIYSINVNKTLIQGFFGLN